MINYPSSDAPIFISVPQLKLRASERRVLNIFERKISEDINFKMYQLRCPHIYVREK
jgi:hypothetical protein